MHTAGRNGVLWRKDENQGFQEGINATRGCGFPKSLTWQKFYFSLNRVVQ